ncbi:superinfection immunity protein [Actinomadura rubrisoli]|uniref:Superinfection immunity protein n=1 Tax=Actinomadura rubrisoli TaxID=2530368 RepID=A0A4R5ALT3_9ACTN|nr:superinfection immunity protein [Actinomadura rubrisoli]TDD71112.1 superinfection immunity protein [Actinomadura rubrisoli]
MAAIQTSAVLWLILIGILVSVAVLPTFIAIARGADDIGFIILTNALCCATVLGWPIALVAAIKWPRRHPRTAERPYQQLPALPLDRDRCRTHGRGPHA